MQLSGQPCALCSEPVMMHADATWCARCKSVLHHACLDTAQQRCPVCADVYEEPTPHFVFSACCPRCLRTSDPGQAECPVCHAHTRWDTAAEFAAFRTRVRAQSRRWLMQSLALLVLAGALLFVPVPATVLAAMVLIFFAVKQLSASRRAQTFLQSS